MTTPGARPRFGLSVALVATLLASACVGGGGPSPFERAGAQEPTRIRVSVDNQNFNDVRVYSITIRGRRSLGQISGRSRATFDVDWGGPDDIRFGLEFLAGGSYETPRVTVSAGDRVEVYIPDNPSNTVVRRR